MNETCEFLERLSDFMDEQASESVASSSDLIQGFEYSAGVISTFVFNTVASEEVIAQAFVVNAFFAVLKRHKELLENDPSSFLQMVAIQAKQTVLAHKAMLESVEQQSDANYINPVVGGRAH